MGEIVWISLEPNNGFIEIYPKKIALQIEKAYLSIDSNLKNKTELDLGFNYNYAKIYFDSFDQFYQTMPICNNNILYDFKSVKRCEVFKGIIEINIVKVYSGNWKISNKLDSKNSIIFRPNPSDIIISNE